GTIQFRSTEEIAGSDLWIGCEVLDRDYADYDAYKDYLPQLGAKKARLQSGWAKTEKEKGVYDFKWLDAIVDDLISKKIEPWMQISYGNPLYPGGGGISLGEGLPTSEEALQAWENYTRALVKHFQGRVSEWEIWNEADHGYNKSSGLEYANLYYRTAKVVRAVQPNAKLLALSMAGINKPKFVKDFLDFLKEKDAIHLVDVVTFHGYLANPDQGFHYIDSLKNLTHTYDPSIAFWQGETGCPSTLATSGALKQYPWSEKLQAKWSLRRALAHLGRGYPYLHFTISEYVYDRELFSGLNSKGLLKINPDKSIAYAKPAYYAYQNLTALLDHDYTLDTTFSYETKSDYHMSAFSWKHKQSGNMVAIWLDGSKPTENDWYIPLDFQFNGISFKDPVVVDTRTGEVFEFPPDQYKVSEKGTEFKNIPVYDSPLIILDRTNAPIKNL
ncbi:MAG: hypothetical protein AAFX53_13010, partial [Bacteroidota bacterium]